MRNKGEPRTAWCNWRWGQLLCSVCVGRGGRTVQWGKHGCPRGMEPKGGASDLPQCVQWVYTVCCCGQPGSSTLQCGPRAEMANQLTGSPSSKTTYGTKMFQFPPLPEIYKESWAGLSGLILSGIFGAAQAQVIVQPHSEYSTRQYSTKLKILQT